MSTIRSTSVPTTASDAASLAANAAYIDADLSLDFIRVVEQAAIACAHTMGQGDRHLSDQAVLNCLQSYDPLTFWLPPDSFRLPSLLPLVHFGTMAGLGK